MNFLRPVYTDYLFKQLQKQSLNVYGSAGQGRERLLADLHELATPAGILVLTANMKAYAKNYDGFINDLTRQLANQLTITDTSLSLEQLIDQHSQQKTVWIFLHNFDAILDNTQLDKQFGIVFFNQLNALKNRPRCFLLCMTERPFRQYHLYAEKIHSLSPLDLGIDALTPLTLDECEQELHRRTLGLLDKHFRQLLAYVYAHSSPYRFLDYACNQIAAGIDNSKSFESRLEIWQSQLKQQQKDSKSFLNIRNIFLIVTFELNALSRTMKKLLVAVCIFIVVIATSFEQMSQVLDSIIFLLDKGLPTEFSTMVTRIFLAFVATGVAVAITTYLGKPKDTTVIKINHQNKPIEDSQSTSSQQNIKNLYFNEQQKNELLELLKQQLTNVASVDLIAEIKAQAATAFQIQDITNAYQKSHDRLYQEIDDLGRRGNINLALGVAITVIGLFILSGFLLSTGKELPQELWSFLVHYLPRLTLILFIELFAYFFLYLYKTSLGEIKYYQNELTNLEAKHTALIAAFKQNDTTTINSVISSLATTERNRILNKNQTTIELEAVRIEKHSTVDISKLLTDLVSSLAPKKD